MIQIHVSLETVDKFLFSIYGLEQSSIGTTSSFNMLLYPVY